MPPQRQLLRTGLRALALAVVAAASLQLALHVATTLFLVRQGLGGDAWLAMVLGLGGAIAAGTWLYHQSQSIAERIAATLQ
jgi:hypothetical protein